MGSPKTKLIVRVQPTSRWVVLNQKEIQQFGERIRKEVEALSQAALLTCTKCGKAPRFAYRGVIYPVCKPCAWDAIRKVLFTDDKQFHDDEDIDGTDG